MYRRMMEVYLELNLQIKTPAGGKRRGLRHRTQFNDGDNGTSKE